MLAKLRSQPGFDAAISPSIRPSSSRSSAPADLSVDTIALLQSLATWFKTDYMRWVDPISCPRCAGPTESVGTTKPSPAEVVLGGGRVEQHRCYSTSCGVIRRFVRYYKVSTLLQTREGRCGEWAHLFYAILRLLHEQKVPGWEGVQARYVWNSEDHVWAEAWFEAEGRWLHVDPWYVPLLRIGIGRLRLPSAHGLCPRDAACCRLTSQ